MILGGEIMVGAQILELGSNRMTRDYEGIGPGAGL